MLVAKGPDVSLLEADSKAQPMVRQLSVCILFRRLGLLPQGTENVAFYLTVHTIGFIQLMADSNEAKLRRPVHSCRNQSRYCSAEELQ